MSATLYGEALLRPSSPVHVRSADGELVRLPTARWSDPLDSVDELVIDRVDGATLDIGCGPGRFVAGIADRGLPVLGIDIAPVAVAMTRRRGGLALHRDVFGVVPGAGRWQWALLMDGNIGIGGAPARLLQRTAELLAPNGRVLVEVGPPGAPAVSQDVRLESGSRVGSWFPWAWVPLQALEALAHDSSMCMLDSWTDHGRWFAELGRRPA